MRAVLCMKYALFTFRPAGGIIHPGTVVVVVCFVARRAWLSGYVVAKRCPLQPGCLLFSPRAPILELVVIILESAEGKPCGDRRTLGKFGPRRF